MVKSIIEITESLDAYKLRKVLSVHEYLCIVVERVFKFWGPSQYKDVVLPV